MSEKTKTIYIQKRALNAAALAALTWTFPILAFYVNEKFLESSTPNWVLATMVILALIGVATRSVATFKSEEDAVAFVKRFFAE